MLMLDRNQFFWACDVCHQMGGEQTLLWVSRNGNGATRCHLVHEACVRELGVSELLTGDEIATLTSRAVSMEIDTLDDWSFFVGPQRKRMKVRVGPVPVAEGAVEGAGGDDRLKWAAEIIAAFNAQQREDGD